MAGKPDKTLPGNTHQEQLPALGWVRLNLVLTEGLHRSLATQCLLTFAADNMPLPQVPANYPPSPRREAAAYSVLYF